MLPPKHRQLNSLIKINGSNKLLKQNKMRTLTLLLTSILLFSCSEAQKPTIADITAALKSTWEHPQTTVREKQTVTVNNIKIGGSDKSNYAQQMDGIPKGTLVTYAKIDFTHNQFYSNETEHVR